MTSIYRRYQDDEDYWRIREFLRKIMVLNGLREFCWHVARLDYWWWFINPDIEKLNPSENIFLWETEQGKIVAVLNPEGRGLAFLQAHPDYKNPALVEEMVSVAEEYLSVKGEDGRKKLWVYVDSRDQIQQEILLRHGFQRVEQPDVREFQHRRLLEDALPEISIPAGYHIRPLGDGLELLERCYASGHFCTAALSMICSLIFIKTSGFRMTSIVKNKSETVVR